GEGGGTAEVRVRSELAGVLESGSPGHRLELVGVQPGARQVEVNAAGGHVESPGHSEVHAGGVEDLEVAVGQVHAGDVLGGIPEGTGAAGALAHEGRAPDQIAVGAGEV